MLIANNTIKKAIAAAFALMLCFSAPGKVSAAGYGIMPQYYGQLKNYVSIVESTNPDIIAPDEEKGTGPAKKIITYVVKPGDTLYDIALKHGTGVGDLAVLNNRINPHRIYPGEELKIPEASEPVHTTAISRGTFAAGAPVSAAPFFGRPLEKGTVTSPFGWRESGFHYGLDIAAPQGTPVLAAADGTVTYSDYRGTYGLLVEIDHGRAWATRYAHNSKTLVKPGQTVKKGEAIAEVGSTGYSTGPHVHFEIIYNNKRLDPEKHLER